MSATEKSRLDDLLTWLGENAFWNSELVEVKPSKLGGLGVFWRLGPKEDPEQDRLLLRVPKSNVLSPKNSFLYSLLVDHQSSNDTIDLTSGMHAIVITYIYELSLGDQSPWNLYLKSFSSESAPLPLCLWDKAAKEALFNTECDLLNMLDPAELTAFYMECVAFAKKNRELVAIPSVLDTVDFPAEELERFGRVVQTVISRAFTVDKYHGLSLVPGADLFNHLSPVSSDLIVEARENVHFECDDDDDLCATCGEIGCLHTDSEEEEEEEYGAMSETDEGIETEEGQSRDPESSAEEGMLDDTDELLDEDTKVESSEESQTESESGMSETEALSEEENDETDERDDDRPITMEDIRALDEEDSEAETVQEDEEVSTLSLSGDEADYEVDGDTIQGSLTPTESELADELSDGSKCCDIVLAQLPSKEFDYELFNTYGNELSNPYLLQRYGFVSPGNPNTTCLLSVQMYGELKKLKRSARAEKQMDVKLQWYEDVGFDIVNDFCSNSSQDHDHAQDAENDECQADHDDPGCEEGCCSGSDDSEVPESWQLSPKVTAEGAPTPQTLALLRLMKMQFSVFYHKIYRSPSERRTEKRVVRYLLEEEANSAEKAILRRWAQERLRRYKVVTDVPDEKREMVETILAEEKKLLSKAIAVLT